MRILIFPNTKFCMSSLQLMNMFNKIFVLALTALIMGVSCSRKFNGDSTTISHCRLISNIIQTINIIDEPNCYSKITLTIDTLSDYTYFTYDLDRRPLEIINWDFEKCCDFNIMEVGSVEVLNPIYRIAHSEMTDFRMHPPDNETCLNLVISYLLKYEKGYLISIYVENHTIESYFGTFIFDLDKKGKPSNTQIYWYRSNPFSKTQKDLRSVYPMFPKKSRF